MFCYLMDTRGRTQTLNALDNEERAHMVRHEAVAAIVGMFACTGLHIVARDLLTGQLRAGKDRGDFLHPGERRRPLAYSN